MVSQRAPHLRLVQRIRRGDSYVLLLGLIVLDYLILSFLEPGRAWLRLLAALITGATLLSALRTSRVNHRIMRVAQVATVAAVALAVVDTLVGSRTVDGAIGLVVGGLLLAAPPAILWRIYRHPEVTVETLAGAVDVYLLLGLVFASVYYAANLLAAPFFVQTSSPTGDQFVYFSYVTLATLGYGDLTPAASLGRTLVVVEAMLGQVYLVTVVARLVALLTVRR